MEYQQEDRELLMLLLNMQEKAAPITLSIGYVDSERQVRQGIVVHSAPPVVLERLVREGYTCSLTEGGMMVYRL